MLTILALFIRLWWPTAPGTAQQYDDLNDPQPLLYVLEYKRLSVAVFTVIAIAAGAVETHYHELSVGLFTLPSAQRSGWGIPGAVDATLLAIATLVLTIYVLNKVVSKGNDVLQKS